MRKKSLALCKMLFICCLTGCLFMPASTILLIGSSSSSPLNVATTNYSLGPFKSPKLESLILSALNDQTHNLLVYGYVHYSWGNKDASWGETYSAWHRRSFNFRGIVAITNDKVIFLKWHTTNNRYDVIQELLFNEITTVETYNGKKGSKIYFEHEEFIFSQTNYGFKQKSSLSFIENDKSGWDLKKNEDAFNQLKKQIKVKKYKKVPENEFYKDESVF